MDAEDPYRALVLPFHCEHLLYALIGRLRVYADGRWLGTIGGRQSVTQPLAHVWRFPAGQETALVLLVEGASADCLLASPPVASGQDDALGDTAMRVVLVLLGLLTLVVLAGVAGFAWEQRASWQAAWAALQDTLWALAARWS